MAKYQKYTEYQDSGVEWLGEIPSHWNAVNLGYLFDITSSKRVFEDQWKSEGVPFYRAREIVRLKNDQDYQNDLFISNSLYTELRKKYGVPQVGDILVTAVGTLGVTYLVENQKEFYFKDGNLIWLKTNNKCDSIFINYCYESFVIKYQMYRDNMGATVGTYTIENAKKNKIFVPPLDEQIAITHFLNNQTQVIDSLISKQEKLIELLKEKRQAVISHAVTKGLNPNVKMKDSGVEWLGQVPEHWGVSRLKNLIASLESGCSVNAADIPAQSHELGVLKTSCVYTRSFRIEENKTVVPEDIHRVKCKVRKGAIIISRMNTPELVGASALVKVEADNIYLPDRLWQTIFFQNIEIDAEYLSHFMTVQGFRDQIALGAEGASSSMQNIAKEDYLNINCLVPPLEEQIEIRDYIEQKLAILGKLNLKAQEAVERLKERRTALISSAVTGKINVMNWQNPNHNNNEANTELGA